jgi:hypothetical protein
VALTPQTNPEEIGMPDSQPIAWRSVVYATPVVSSDGQVAGEVREVLGSDADDIFHGLRVALKAGRRDVLVSADDVASLTATQVLTSLPRSDLDALPTFQDEATYHLASIGWLRKHLGWKKDSESDEEPG